MKTLKIVGTDTLLVMAKQLKDREEITQEKYDGMVKRNDKLKDIERKDITINYMKY